LAKGFRTLGHKGRTWAWLFGELGAQAFGYALYQASHFGNALIHGPYHPIPIDLLHCHTKTTTKITTNFTIPFRVNLLKVSKSVDLGGINNHNYNNNNNNSSRE